MYVPYGKQSKSDVGVKDVVALFKPDWLTQGPVVQKFGSAIENAVNCRHAIAFNSATRALHLTVRMQSLRLSHCSGLGIKQVSTMVKYKLLRLESFRLWGFTCIIN